jgi:hypothetical protein
MVAGRRRSKQDSHKADILGISAVDGRFSLSCGGRAGG